MSTQLTRRSLLGMLAGGAAWSLAACQSQIAPLRAPPTLVPAHPTRLGVVVGRKFSAADQQAMRAGYQQAVDAVVGRGLGIDRQMTWIPISSAQSATEEIATAFIGSTNAGTAVPDLLVFGNRPSLADSPYLLRQLLSQPLLRPIDAEMRRAPSKETQDYYPNVLDTCRVGGTLYGLPLGVDPMLLLVDPRLLTQAQLTLPGAWTWSDLVNASQQLTRAPSQYASAPRGLPDMETFLWQHGAAVLSADGTHSTLDDAAAIEAAAFYADLFTRYHVVAPTVPTVNAWSYTPDHQITYNGARVAMISASSGAPGRPLQYSEPFHDRDKATALFLTTVLAMTVRAADPVQSFSVMTALATELQQSTYLPPRQSLLKTMQPVRALSGWLPSDLSQAEQTALTNALGYARASQVWDPKISAPFYSTLQSPLQQGTATAADACKAAADAINAVLQKQAGTPGPG